MQFQDPISRVPYFYFEEKECGEDAEKSLELGYAVPKMKTMIRILPHGHRGDPYEFFAEDFIPRKDQEARSGRYDPNWVDEFKAGLKRYREGKEIPRSGTPLITYERLLKSRREQLAPKFPTVEDLAAVPDSALGDIGLDGRILRDMALSDIQAKKDLSPVVKELSLANETIRRQEQTITDLAARLDALEAKNKARRNSQQD